MLGIEQAQIYADSIHYRLAVASLLVVMLAGLLILLKVPRQRRFDG
jgi:MFS-type transporter involved in bile tolerance (Atg22 family)